MSNDNPPQMRRGRIVALILTAALLPLAAMVVFATVTARQALQQEILQTAIASSRGGALLVDADIVGKRELLALFARRRALNTAVARHDQPGVERLLIDLAADILDFERAFVTDATGTLWAHYPDTDPTVLGRNFAAREWYLGASKNQALYLSGAYQRAAQPVRLVYTFATPLFDQEQRLTGYLGVQDTGGRLRQSLEKLTLPAGSSAALIDHNGHVVFEIGTARLPPNQDLRTINPCIDDALRGREGTALTSYIGATDVVVCAPARAVGWAVIAHFPTDQLLRPLRTIAWQISGAGMLLLLLVGVLAARWASTYARNRHLLAEGERLTRELDLQSNRYWALLDSSADGLAMANNDKTLLYMNRTFGRLFGFSDAERLIGRPMTALHELLFPLLAEPEHYQQNAEQLWRQDDSVGDFEMPLTDRRVVHFYSHPVRDRAGRRIGRSLICRDLTRERELERMKNEFVATVSHELRTPLASLLGFSELMLTRKLPAQKQREFIEIIHKESQRLNGLINDFLDLQRIESGGVAYVFEALDLPGVVREVAALFASDAKHSFTLDLPTGLPAALGDHGRIQQVVQNLVSNALKYSPAGGAITITLRARADAMLEVTVTDQGLGIPEEALAGLFGKFFRVDGSDRREIGGTGLGLALCKEIVQAHQGTIWVESRLGTGSSFRFTLPLAATAVVPTPVAGAPYVLVVEDDAAFATLVSEHLAEVGLAVHISPSAEEALAHTHTATPALIFLDIHLAGNLDGWDFLTTVKADPRFATIPVIITTVTEKRARGLALGAADYLVKPFPMERLLDAVRCHLPAPQGRQVLIADDDAAFRGVLAAALLAEFGSQVHETGDGHDALAQIQAQAPDLVILDLLMPGLDGFEVLKHLRLDPRTTHLPVLVVTGVDLTPADKERLRHGMARVLTKAEYSQQNLLTLVRELVNPAPTAHGAATGDMP